MARKLKFLVCDESITIQKMIHITLINPQSEISVASDGPDALQKIGSQNPDFVFIDAQLRNAKIPDLFDQIKGAGSQARLILMKGPLSPLEEKLLEGLKFDGILHKPFDSKAINALVGPLIKEEEESTVVQLSAAKAEEKLEAAVAEVNSDSEPPAVEEVSEKKEVDFLAAASVEASAPVQKASPFDQMDDTKKIRPSEFRSPVNEIVMEKTGDKMLGQIAQDGIDSKPETAQMQKIAENLIRDWIQNELPTLAEKILKEEIQRQVSQR